MPEEGSGSIEREAILLQHTGEGLEHVDVTKLSPYSVSDRVQRIAEVLRAPGLTIFALIDHCGEAARIDLTMWPTNLLVFGSPAAKTPLTVASPLLALDLSLKAFVWQDVTGQVMESYNSTDDLAARRHLTEVLLPTLAGIDALVANALAH